MSVDDSDDCLSDVCSTESLDVNVIEAWIEEELEEGILVYRCREVDGTIVEVDRSDLMDGGKHQRLVMDFERRMPPPWDKVCSYCDGEKCEECVCEECDRPMRHIKGINYGCVMHPVV
tara:strand:+ start:3183 stop:3536 length:354 start_codon:yes stop_codon:yes gene_type:complete